MSDDHVTRKEYDEMKATYLRIERAQQGQIMALEEILEARRGTLLALRRTVASLQHSVEILQSTVETQRQTIAILETRREPASQPVGGWQH